MGHEQGAWKEQTAKRERETTVGAQVERDNGQIKRVALREFRVFAVAQGRARWGRETKEGGNTAPGDGEGSEGGGVHGLLRKWAEGKENKKQVAAAAPWHNGKGSKGGREAPS